MAQSICTPLAAATSPTNTQAMRQLWHWFLPTDILTATTRHGNCTWQPNLLVIQAFLWTWSQAPTLTEAFDEATQYCRTLRDNTALSTYQGFMNALGQWSPLLITNLIVSLRQHAAEMGGRFWKIGQWIAIGFDGSQSAAPRSKSNEAANYGKGKTAKYRKKKTKGMRRRNNQNKPAQPPQPRVWITMLWHMSLRLPWAWRLGSSNSSERHHVMAMIAEEHFPETTLFCGDAGFIGYPLWSRIVQKGHHFLVRVGANVHLLVETLNGRIATVG